MTTDFIYRLMALASCPPMTHTLDATDLVALSEAVEHFKNQPSQLLQAMWPYMTGDDNPANPADALCTGRHEAPACADPDCIHAQTPVALQPLYKFYGVCTLGQLIDAQARHIEKLQAKLSRVTEVELARLSRNG